jgi:poly-gamma-glutamate synthesis protein (capsule biosynthesis protein)
MTDAADDRSATLLLCGDVMTGRGIDQILRHPSRSELFEPYVKDAGEYVAIAEAANGPVPRRVRDSYIWGDALAELAHASPRIRIANLETSITRSDEAWLEKGVHYRMHPANVGCLKAVHFDVCTLANNHVLDFGYRGLAETIDTLTAAGIRTAGAGADLATAQQPAIVPLLPGSRLVVVAFGLPSSGIPDEWAAAAGRPGVDVVARPTAPAAAAIAARVAAITRFRDVVVASIHWGGNWGYEVPAAHRVFAHTLIDGGVDLVYGHSSHHPRPIEIYRDRLILYGCGDFINDYEGISGYDAYRDDLTLMYFVTVSADSGAALRLRMVPMQIKRLRLARASLPDARWLRETLARVSAPFHTHIDLEGTGEPVLAASGAAR